jgi:hypothetical protein
MVFISRTAKKDLDNIVTGLLKWDKVALTVSEVIQYVDDIADICYQLDNLEYHRQAKYKSHLEYGAYSYPYKRNKMTTWYIIYDIDLFSNVCVNKIISNHHTIL